MRDDHSLLEHPAEEFYAVVAREILPRLGALEACRSIGELQAHPAYGAIAATVEQAFGTPHIADFRRGAAPAKPRYRVVAWNVERGTQFDAQVRALREHPYLRECDVLLLTEADAGMARSGNRMVAEQMARELGMAQVFAPCYIALGKGSGVERDIAGENTFGLHGNAVLSRYPVRGARLIPLVNGVDKMRHREKRIGRQVAVAARIEFPNLAFDAVSVHLDAQSTQRHRLGQMRRIVEAQAADLPALFGGDWNTSTYNSSHAFWAIMGFWLRVFMGVDNVIRNHYLHPERWFERKLFRLLERNGFDFRQANRLGEYTTFYDLLDARATRNLGEWVPGWCFAFIRWALRNHGGRCPLKLDWFAARGLGVENPVVVHGLTDGRGAPLSDHDPIGIDVPA
jgi:endonuclease/exonuclease/phosphatase family metal-dependent hydrolase